MNLRKNESATVSSDAPVPLESYVDTTAAAPRQPHPVDLRAQRRAALNLMEDALESRRALENANAELRERERRFREMIDALPAAVYTTDADGRITHFNSECVALSGRTPVLGTDQWCVTWKLYHPDGTPMPHDECPMAIALSAGRAVRGAEAIAERPDGTRVWFTPYPTPLKDTQGRIIGGINMLVDITERKLAEQEARRRTRQLAAFMETAAIGLHRVGPDGVILWANDAESQLLGYTREEYVGHHIAEFHADQQVIADILERLQRGETLHEYEAQLRCKDGGIKTVLIDSTALFEEGRFLHTQCFTIDITERKWAETLLQHQKEALEMVARQAPLADVLEFLARSVESRSREVMVAAIHLLDPAGTHFSSVAAPSLPAAYAQATDGLAVDSRADPCCDAVLGRESVIIRDMERDPRWPRFAEVALPCGIRAGWSTPIFSPGGQVLGTFAIYYREPRQPSPQDQRLLEIVTRTVALAIEHTQAVQAVRASDAKYRTIFDGAAVSLWEEDFSGVKASIDGLRLEGVTDVRRYCEEHPEFVQEALARIRVLDVNDATVKMFEARDKSELLGALPQIFTAESLPVFIEELCAVAEGRRFMQGEALLSTVRGNPISVMFTMTLSSHREPLDQALFSLLNITERVRMEDQMRQQAVELSDLHRRKDEFLAMLSHELRNPLAPIANAVQLLRLQRGEQQAAHHAHARTIIERQVGHLRHLVDDLLEISRYTSGKFQLRQERVDLGGIVAGAVETARPTIDERRHELSVAVPPEPVWLYADAARLEQVVVNLLTNAARYTDEGGRIWLTAEQEGTEAVLRVRDTGIGIAPDLLPRIFDLFTQADRGLDRPMGGLGIGLSLVQRLVERHGGTVRVASALGHGSEFVVRLPVTSAPASLAPPIEGQQTVGTACRVLVVDDNADSAESLAMLLRASNHDVRIAHDSASALTEVVDYRPDVVLLDIGLPGLNGFEVAKRIREQPALEHTVLVALTGYGQESDRQRSRDAGFDHHLVKPAEFSKIEEILATVAESMA